MSYVNSMAQEVICKIVYVGPGQSGKTANLRALYDRSNPNLRGSLISPTQSERTLLFEFLPMSLGEVGGMKTYCHLYAVSGQLLHALGRRLVLRGADGVVFVADSTEGRREANLDAMEELHEHLRYHGFQPGELPMVVQYNKRDVADAVPVEELRALLHSQEGADMEASSIRGQGVFDTMKLVVRLAMSRLQNTELAMTMVRGVTTRKIDARSDGR